MRNNLILSLLLFFALPLKGAKLSGIVTDNKNVPLPFVIVYVSGTSYGTTANNEGIYSLELQPGTYDISFRMIGYVLITKKVVIAESPVRLDIQLPEETIKLKEVTINAGEDPAYAIIRKAQEKRKFYREQVKLYKANAYVKSTQRLVGFPKKVLGQKVEVEEYVDSVTKIFYLSESVSELFFSAPDKYKERMISSKVSGSPRTYSFNQSTDVLISFYDNLVSIGELTPRGIVSPIASNSLFYYNFRHEGTFYENGVLVNKISVIPKRRFDPVFTGTIYIMEDTWRIYSTDVTITREQQMEFIDTFHIKQNFIRVNDEVWMPFSHQFDYSFNFMGFKGGGVVLGVFSDYFLNPKLNRSFFNGEVMSVEESANTKDTAYWKETRPVPLSADEIYDYTKKDSTRIIHESKQYLDSMDKISNKISFSSFLTGYTWENSYKHKSVSVVTPFQRINFNTVEGFNTVLEITYKKRHSDEDPREFSITPGLRYGFSNTHWNGNVVFSNRYNAHHNSVLDIEAGTDVEQINNKNPISEMLNSMYSLWAEKNYMKIFERQYLYASHRTELVNGISLRLTAEYAKRSSLSNTTDYSFINVKKRDYTSNDPYNSTTDEFKFNRNEAFTFEAGLAFRPGQKYITRPEGKYNLGSIWPVIRLTYKKGIEALGSDVDFDIIRMGIDDEMNLGLFGKITYQVVYGNFLNNNKYYIPDLKHFNGNKTWFSDFRINDFKNLDYYQYSTAGAFLEIHAEENFGGFFLNKIPLIRKLKLREIAGFHFLHTESLDRYAEFSVGVEKLGIFRAEFYTSLTDGKKGTIGFLVGLKRVFGNR